MTPAEDKPEELTPADLRRRQRSGAWVFGLFLVLVLAGLLTTVLAVNDGRNYHRLVSRLGLEDYLLPAIAPKNIRIDRLKQGPVAERYPPWLLAARLERQAKFEKDEPASAEDRCKRLKQDDGPGPQFTNLRTGWECTFFQEFTSAAPEHASIFFQAKGPDADTTTSLRVKLNLTDESVEPAVIEAAASAVRRFGLPMTPESRTYIDEMLAARRPFSSGIDDYRMSFGPEGMDPRRYNLVILPRPQQPKCGEQPTDPDESQQYRTPIACRPLPGTPRDPGA